ncbi:MAG: hypothetical protein WA294_21025 [Acidobacteriaceae bacterium]
MIGSPLMIAEKARERLRSAVAAMREGHSPDNLVIHSGDLPDPADLVITACEVNEAHGTGILVRRMFPDSSSIVSVRTHNFYDGDQKFGAAAFCLPLASGSRVEVSSTVQIYLRGARVRRALCIPYLPGEATVSLALKDLHGMPLCTYVMDDKNVAADGICDELMEELLAKSDLRLVIGPEMRDAYEQKYGMKFWVVPPLVSEEVIRTTLTRVPAPPYRGVLLGNIWGQRWLDLLRKVLRGSGLEVDWYCNIKDPKMLHYDRGEMERDGLRLIEPVPEAQLPAMLARYSYAVVPTDPLDGMSPAPVEAIARFSLPSRIPTLVVSSQLPMLVVGSPATSASGFVRRFALGEIVPYEQSAAVEGVRLLLDPARQKQIRERALAMSSSFSARGSGEWIWRSLEQGAPCDMRYEALLPRLSEEVSGAFTR